MRMNGPIAKLIFYGFIILLGCERFSESKVQKISATVSGSNGIDVVDVTGRRVSLKSPAKRIVSLSPGFTETLFQIGCGDRVIVRDKWSDFPPKAKKLPATDSVNPSVEAIGGFDPDLVLLYFNDARHQSAFSKIGVETAVFDPKTYNQVAGDIVKMGILCGEPEHARAVAQKMKNRRDKVVAKSSRFPKLRVYVEIDGSDASRPWTAGRGSFIDELLQLAGAQNVFSHVKKPYVQVNLEEVIAQNPEVILLAGTEETNTSNAIFLKRRPGFDALDAVRNNRILYSIDKNLLSRPGARLAEGLEKLYAALHTKEASH